MKKMLWAFLFTVVCLTASGLNAQEDVKKKSDAAAGKWENTKVFHLDGALLASMAYYPWANYSGFNGAMNYLASFRLSGLLDFSFSSGSMSYGFEPVVNVFSFEMDLDGDNNDERLYFLDINARLFIRKNFKNSFVQLFGGYYYSVFGDASLNGIEAGLRLAISDFTIDASYVFAKRSQVRLSFGSICRLL